MSTLEIDNYFTLQKEQADKDHKNKKETISPRLKLKKRENTSTEASPRASLLLQVATGILKSLTSAGNIPTVTTIGKTVIRTLKTNTLKGTMMEGALATHRVIIIISKRITCKSSSMHKFWLKETIRTLQSKDVK